MDSGYLHHRLTPRRQVFVVLAQCPVAPLPGQGALHHPTHVQRHELPFPFWPALDLEPVRPPVPPQPAVQLIVVVLTVGVHHLETREVAAAYLGEDSLGRPGVVHVGGRHHHDKQQTHDIYQDMSLAAVDLFATVAAARLATLGRLDRLTVDGGSAGRGRTSGLDADLRTEGIEEALPGAIPGPPLKVVIDRLPGRKVMGQRSPTTTLADMVEECVENLTHVRGARPPARPRLRNQRFQNSPLLVSKITGIRFASHILFYGQHPL